MIALAVVVAVAAAGGACIAAAGGAWGLAAVAAGAGAVVVAVALAMAAAAWRPRIERRGGCLRLRLSPWGSYDVPLDVIECFFHGAHPVGQAVEPCTGEASHHEEHAEAGGRRRTTLVVRIAERAREWQRRPTFAPWAGWNRGSIVVDGLWCEPLSMERFGALAQKLLEAKRGPAVEAKPGPAGSSRDSA